MAILVIKREVKGKKGKKKFNLLGKRQKAGQRHQKGRPGNTTVAAFAAFNRNKINVF